ncbi:hypothetical protein ACFFGH_02860 [Lysobacter korlensis]|uniref:Uncharacterized protein n=1 Tax=Lysobacter korlensis TaxID=553636 RepID=A0ABV6RLE2_9GAMM
MAMIPRWLAPAVLATGLGIAGLSPAPAHAQSGDELVRVIVDVADVIMRGDQPYYRHGNYGRDDRLVVSRDRYGRPVYYRQSPYADRYPTGYGYGYGDDRRDVRRTKCNKHGKCKVEYYDPRHDRRNDRAYYRDDRRRYEVAHERWHDRYDD